MNTSLKLSYGLEKNNAAAFATVAAKAGDVKFKASMTDATFANGPSLTGLVLAVEKPGSFGIDFDVPKKDFKFRFMNTINVAEKPLNLTYMHNRGENRTTLDGALVVDSANKVSGSYMFGTKDNFKLKYTYVHRGTTTFEPCFDFAGKSWDFMLSRKVYGDDVVRATYKTSNRVIGLDWSRNSKQSFKISAIINLNEESKVPKLFAESTWTFES